ncbi:MAG TPA: DnaJ domain-containing protein [Pyrinomonadaceae bacterium]|nr:DnaJ domain-containing protein [Pyrinomonadaceae bacterium]
MKGKLTAQPLAELIREISDKGLSGTLRLEHERVQAAVYFAAGQIVYAAANLKALRLREYLNKVNLLTEQQRHGLDPNLPDLTLAAGLASSGMMKQKDVSALMSILIRDVLRVALLWTNGSWELNERGRLAETVRVNLDLETLLRDTAQRLPGDFVTERLRNQNEVITRGASISRSSNFLPAESFLLSRLDKPMKLGELVLESGLPELEALRVIYGLALSGFVEREYWQNAFRSDIPRPVKEKQKAAAEVGQAERSDAWLAASVENEDLSEFLARQRRATNHYEVLELTEEAKLTEIKDAYYAMARRYHPDRFHLKSGTKQHAEIGTVFARITHAYDTLVNPETRATYDLTLMRTKKLAQTAKPKDAADDDLDDLDSGGSRAEHSFKEGFAALDQGRFESAIQYLATAVRLDPQDARFRAYYGKALAANESTRRLAENEIQTAVKLEPNNILFRTMLAELYFELKFHRRAQAELDRVLAVDPKNGQANLLLRKLEKSRRVS